ncbi:MAG: 50S ribosomal protein L15 [Candidatus Levybacteria bacterium RIFCSPHIGHO2_01_FULL_37_17]|nr:MAG: 50S ribosomal protein L15 [Candidatus Levybacteria bacterium RIFCSPHIGHO2_01_FULL_37_17]OGH37083.1 MAG: 50S ribosomal protein L15 [Candidatus Levybacteria bacterium RIFCSPLOWO2_01_FULL_38_23]
MNLNSLSKIKKRGKKRLGQGHGSGRVKTAGRGTKGQNSRGKIALSFEGGALPLIKRLPLRRGKGENKAFKKEPIIVNIKLLEILKDKTEVDLKTLVKERIVNEKDAIEYGIKILGDGKISKALIIKLPISKQAAKKIEKAGGRIESSPK